MGNQENFTQAMEQNQQAVNRGDWGRALKEAVRAMQEFPERKEARIAMAMALFHNQKLPQALQLLQELSTIEPGNPTVMEYLARTQHRQGDTETAMELFMQLSEKYAEQGDPSQMVRIYREVLDINEKHEEARIRLAMALAATGDKHGAIREFLFLGNRYLQAGELEAASDAAQEAINIDPDSLTAQDLQKRVRQALQQKAQAEAPPPEDKRLKTREEIERAAQLAIEYQNNGKLEQAAEMYEKLTEVMPERADVRYSLGLVYEELDQFDKALQQLEQATYNDEYALSAHYAMGTIFQKLGKLERAAQEYEQSIRFVDLQSIGREEANDLIDMYEATASIYQELGDIARAASLYSTLAGFFQGKRWGAEQATHYNAKAKELTDRSMMSKLRMLGTGFLTSAPPQPEAAAAEPEQATEMWGRMPSITDFLENGEAVATDKSDTGFDQLLGASATPAVTLPTDIDPLDALAASFPETNIDTMQFAPLTPIDASDRPSRIQRLVEACERFAEQELIYAALDACHEVIRYDQEFYAIHLRMAELLERLGRPDEALSKLNLLISTYKARSEMRKAIDVYYRLIDLSPDPSAVRIELAEVLRNENRPSEAAEQLAWVASQQFRLGQTMKSLESFRRALDWAPENTTLRAQYGQVLLKLERWEAALDEFRYVLQQTPDDLVVLAQTNIALAMMGSFPDAVWDSLNTIMEKIPQVPHAMNDVQAEYRSMTLIADRPLLHFVLGIIQQAAQMHSSALLSFEQALDLLEIEADPLLPLVLVHQAMADSYIAEGRAAQSIDQLQKIEAILATAGVSEATSTHSFARPFNEGELQRRLAEAYAAGDNLEGAIQSLQKVKQLLPYDRAAYTKLADIYFRQGRLQDAMAQLDELATYYENQSQLDRALEILANALKLAPNNISIKSRYAQMQLRRGYLDDGLENLNELAELQRKQGQLKEAVKSLQQVADVYWTLGQMDKAADMYNRIVQVAPNDTEARQHLVSFNILSLRTKEAIDQLREIARLSVQQRNYEEAIASYHQVIALDQKDANAYEQLADVLMRVNEYGQAVRVYKQLAKLVPDDERVEALQNAAQRMLDQQVTNANSNT